MSDILTTLRGRIDGNRLLVTEFAPAMFSKREVPSAVFEYISDELKGRISVDYPTPRSRQRWTIRSRGWIGHFPLVEGWELHIEPKTGIGNFFRMLDYAFKVKFEERDGVVGAGIDVAIFERLALILSQMIEKLHRGGLAKEYINRSREIAHVKGRLATPMFSTLRTKPQPQCDYQETTVDNPANQILVYTLGRLLDYPFDHAPVRKHIRRVEGELRKSVSPPPFTAEQVRAFRYDRLNAHYLAAHSLCALFLEQLGPRHETGATLSVPFAIQTEKVFEEFVAEWLRRNCPPEYNVVTHKREPLGGPHPVRFDPDILLVNERGEIVAIMDTKYKVDNSAKSDDVQQVMAYAKVFGGKRAFLVYPRPLKKQTVISLDDGFRLDTVAFDLRDNDFDRSGTILKAMIFQQ